MQGAARLQQQLQRSKQRPTGIPLKCLRCWMPVRGQQQKQPLQTLSRALSQDS